MDLSYHRNTHYKAHVVNRSNVTDCLCARKPHHVVCGTLYVCFFWLGLYSQYVLQEFQQRAKMKSCFLYAACLFFVFMTTSVTADCDPRTGPAGSTHCYLNADHYDRYQCGTCLSNTYIVQKTKGKSQCRGGTFYCYYQCMVERYGAHEGRVHQDCLCDPNVQLPQHSVLLPSSCYSPDGTDCSWYSRCLARMFDCTGQAEYVIQFSEKTCNSFRESNLNFTAKGLRWIDAARKCLQVELVPLLHLCRERPTCHTIRKTAFDSHEPCYLSPYQGSSMCDMPPTDWYKFYSHVKYDIQSSHVSPVFVAALETLIKVVSNCSTNNYRNEIVNNLYSSDVRLSLNIGKHSTDDMSDDEHHELAHSIVLRISLSLHWNQLSTMDWYAFAVKFRTQEKSLTSSTNPTTRGLKIQVICLR